jgi:SAM-dependent methyltransferase
MSFYRVLNHPLAYNAAQRVFAPGGEASLTNYIASLTDALVTDGPLLDVGCGPRSWLWRVGLRPVGVDIEPAYVDAYIRAGGQATLGSADAIPHGDASFAGVWSIGVLHHLADAMVAGAIGEAIRVCRPGGYVAMLDAVLPTSPWRRPLAAFIRRLDRGRHMRQEGALRSLLDPFGRWHYTRFTYSATGLEMLACLHRRPLASGPQFQDAS